MYAYFRSLTVHEHNFCGESFSLWAEESAHRTNTSLLNDSPVSFPKIKSLKDEVGSVLFPAPLNIAVLSNIYSELWGSHDSNPWYSFDMHSS
jgi:hypothetical protein